MAKGRKTGGRKKGTPNKIPAALKDAILEAAKRAGGGDEEGVVNYLQTQADANPGPFLSLLGKVLPLQIAGTDENGNITGLEVTFVRSDSKD